MKIYSWFDVEDIILRRKMAGDWPEGVAKILVYSDGIEVILHNISQRQTIIDAFSNWFGSRWFDPEKIEVSLEAAQGKVRSLPINIEVDVNERAAEVPPLRPTFSRVTLYPDEPSRNSQLPAPWRQGTPPLIAFYSFKGGVSRTLHLTALAKVLSERQPSRRLLIVDADLEAPGLTWWAKKQGESPEVSFLDFLALAHYDHSENAVDAIELVAERLREIQLTLKTQRGNVQHFFLPSFRDEEQFLRMPIRPEDLSRTPGKAWCVSDYLITLGKTLEVDAVLVDLRAGLSELASPILFDPRVIRVILTSISQQSDEGTRLILKQVRKLTPMPDSDQEITGDYHDPKVIISMVPEEFKDLPRLNDLRESFYALFPDKSEDFISLRVSVEESYFAQELLSLDSLETALEKLSGTSVERLMILMANDWVPSVISTSKEISATQQKDDLRKLVETCRKFEFAESGEGKSFLRTPSLRNLGQRFQNTLPVALIIGAKGAGKTFLYLQLARLQNWQAFQQTLNISKTNTAAHIWPLLSSANLQEEARNILNDCRSETQKALEVKGRNLDQTEIKDQIRKALKEETWNESDWRHFWFRLMAESLSFTLSKKYPLDIIQENLNRYGKQVIFMFDGLEDLFQEININISQQRALRTLLVDVPQNIKDLRNSRVGVVIFIRRDLIKTAVRQNSAQLEALYQLFELRWDQKEILRLAAWVCQEAQLTNYLSLKDIEEVKQEKLEEALYPIWGKKLGKDDSREAYTANWVVSALSDFRGQLQARDMVRLLRYAAERAPNEKPYHGRLIPPAAVRNAIAPCSRDKIKEIKQEVHRLNEIFEKFTQKSEHSIPFQADEFDLTSEEINFLESVGIILEDKKEYYMPEIFRHGLGFNLGYRARPKVVALLKKALSRK